ncbi:barstar family protein [Tsukamurella tyrosinosolvens]|uniref:barstar family protein n=1 Tax=Tsukamurella tyrosinosolvens TaxID=57704 RepID=UPI000C7EE302|nr:barstar family protein [Tsukamurella tyrosinosolvens]AUN38933.1 ribonuclease inhibitor [Tsukamurella tyrosinosolvens]QRY85651.1 barstar family protein [Tsukamurella tyrosinosolvens]
MKTYTVDGSRVTGAADFYTELGRAVNGPDGYFGSNLDALVDCLRGGFGTPEDEAFGFRLTHADEVRTALGAKLYSEVLDVFATAGVPVTAEPHSGRAGRTG